MPNVTAEWFPQRSTLNFAHNIGHVSGCDDSWSYGQRADYETDGFGASRISPSYAWFSSVWSNCRLVTGWKFKTEQGHHVRPVL